MRNSLIISLVLLLDLYLNTEVYGLPDKTTVSISYFIHFNCSYFQFLKADRIQNFGYTCETHTITTKDGYILNIFRIVKSSKGIDNATEEDTNNKTRPVVLMMHGLLSSSDGWVINGPSDALAFNLVDKGYDVWLGNGRGTPYGDHHISLNSKEKKFWRFSWHEIAIVDLPATMDYILKKTGQSSMHYVGHSQGTVIMFVLLSTRPKYNQKLKSSHMLAPIAYMKNVRSRLFKYLAPILGSYTKLDPLLGDMPFLQQQVLVRAVLGVDKCRRSTANVEYCSRLLYTIGGGSSNYINNVSITISKYIFFAFVDDIIISVTLAGYI